MIGLFGPLLLIGFYPEISFIKNSALIVLLIVSFRVIYNYVYVHFDQELNFQLIKAYKEISKLPVEYKDNLIWDTNSKKYSIYRSNNKKIYIMVHRDSGRVELVKSLKKFYNRIIYENKLLLKAQKDIESIENSIDKMMLVLRERTESLEKYREESE